MPRTNHRWTEADVETLKRLTEAGETAQFIADAIGSTAGTVAMMRKKHHIFISSGVCLHCDAELVVTATRGRRPQYCDDVCQAKHRIAIARAERLSQRAELRCKQCGAVIPAEGSRRGYCSHACSKRAWYERSRENKEFLEQRRITSRAHYEKKRARES